jgi:glycosyltransferase involved in cell wall biosynthesis
VPVKLIIQIPCWNEEETLPVTFNALPKRLPGVDVIETLIIDDGSSDRTVEVARGLGFDHIVRLVTHQGLARAFERGILECLARGADVVVNTDADNQYVAADMGALVAPILSGEADYVIGNRGVEDLEHFSWIKKKLQRFGSYVVRVASNTTIPDTTSGYRALSRRAILRLKVHSEYTYTHETLIQAGRKDLLVKSVPVGVNLVTRPSRLFKSIPRYVFRSANTILRIYLIYNAFRVLTRLAFTALLAAVACVALHFALPRFGVEHGLGSFLLWAGGASFFVATQLLLSAMLADLLAVNRRLQEENLAYLRELAFDPKRTAEEPSQDSPGAESQ